MLKAPPITPVTTTDRVSRYTQNVSANHRNELVTPLTRELASSWRNVRSASAGRTDVAGPSRQPTPSSGVEVKRDRRTARFGPDPGRPCDQDPDQEDRFPVVVAAFERGERVPVVVTIDGGYQFRNTIAPTGGQFLISFNAESITGAKTEATRAKRVAKVVDALRAR